MSNASPKKSPPQAQPARNCCPLGLCALCGTLVETPPLLKKLADALNRPLSLLRS